MIAGEGILFQGPGPYALPLAQSARATANKDNGVDITFYILADEPNQLQKAVRIQMAASVALDLAHQLGQAAVNAESG